MKKNLFILVTSALFLILGGVAFTACNDDSESTPPDGDKVIELRVVDDSGSLTTADVSIKKDGTQINSVLVAGSYSLDVAKDKSGTVYTFKASRDNYVDSEEQSVTLNYTGPSDAFSAYLVLKITKKGTNSTLKPNEDNNFIIRSSLTRDGRQINVNVPAGAVDKEVSFTPTSIPTAGSQGDIDADAPNGSFALEIIDIESNWTGNFLNGKTATFSFPLRQELINNTVKKGIPLFFGSNSGGSWESYPVTINETTGTGTVSIPHFSRWYLTTNILIDISVSQTPFEILGTSSCGENVTVTFNKTNAPIPDFYRNVFGLTSLPNVSQDDTRTGQNGKYWIIRGRCVQKTVSISGTGVAIPSYTYYRAPVTFSSTTVNCDHSGGGGE